MRIGLDSNSLSPATLASATSASVSLTSAAYDVGLLLRNKKKFLISVDEVGRGCVAGPVCVSASLHSLRKHDEVETFQTAWQKRVADSKKLSAIKRSQLFNLVAQEFAWCENHFASELLGESNSLKTFLKTCKSIEDIKNHMFSPSFQTLLSASEIEDCRTLGMKSEYALKLISAKVCALPSSCVDKFNIWNCVQIAASLAVNKIFEEFPQAKQESVLLVDGKLPFKVFSSLKSIPQFSAIGGDGIFASVGISSVLAKHARDEFMCQLSSHFPNYGFEKHKGYGTKNHMELISKFGLSPYHRETFLTGQ